MPVEKSELGDVFVTSNGNRVHIDESKIKAVPDGSRRLNWNPLPSTPVPEDTGAVKQAAAKLPNTTPTANDERLTIDIPEYREQFGHGITPDFIRIVPTGRGNRTRVEQVIPATWLDDDPIVQMCSREYGAALKARAAGLPHDANMIALQQSPEWRDPAFRAAYYNSRRPKR